jgi:hypothetical protein
LNNILSAVRKLKVSIAEAREPLIVLPRKKRKEAKERKRHMRLEKKRDAMAEKSLFKVSEKDQAFDWAEALYDMDSLDDRERRDDAAVDWTDIADVCLELLMYSSTAN